MNPRNGEEYFYKVDNLLLISTQHLRSRFAIRWKEETGTDWESSESQGRQLIEGLSQQIKKSLQSSQKAVIEKGGLGEWNLSTLSLVLQHFGKLRQFNKHETEPLKALTRLRNELELNQKKKFSRQEYNEKLEIIKKSLRALEIDEKYIMKIIEWAGVTSSATALETSQKLLEKAKGHLKEREFNDAVESYEEHGNDVEYNLLIASDAVDEFSCKASHILGQLQQMTKNFTEALFYLQLAVKLAPLEEQPKADLESCKLQYLGTMLANGALILNNKEEENGVENGGTSGPDPTEENCQRVSDATRIKETLRDIRRLTKLFQRGKSTLSESEQSVIVDIMYNRALDEYDVFNLTQEMNENLNTFLHVLLNSKPKNKVKPNEKDMKIRLSYIVFTLHQTKSVCNVTPLLKLAKKGLEMYPDNPHYHWLLSKVYGSLDEHLAGLKVADNGWKRFPNHAGLRLVKAYNLGERLGLEEGDIEKYIEAYNDYLQVIPFDHWKISNIYCMYTSRYVQAATEKNWIFTGMGPRKVKEIVEHYYRLGNEAEERVHPYFKATMMSSLSTYKKVVEDFLSKFELEDGSEEEQEEIQSSAETDLEEYDGITEPEQMSVEEMIQENAKVKSTFYELQLCQKDLNGEPEPTLIQNGLEQEITLQTDVDQPMALSEEFISQLQSKEPFDEPKSEILSVTEVQDIEELVPNRNSGENTCTVMEQVFASVPNPELSEEANAEPETKLASDFNGLQSDGETSESSVASVIVKYQNGLEPELTLDEQLPSNESKVSTCEEVVSFLQPETGFVDPSMLLAEEPANMEEERQFVDELVLVSDGEVLEVQPTLEEHLTLQAVTDVTDNSKFMEKMPTFQNQIEIVEPEPVLVSIQNIELNEEASKNPGSELNSAAGFENGKPSTFADFESVQENTPVQRPKSLQLSPQNCKQPPSLLELLDLTQNELSPDFNETVAEEPTLNEEVPNVQPQNGKLTSFNIKLPLSCLALYLFAQGHFMLGVCMVFYILYLLGRAN